MLSQTEDKSLKLIDKGKKEKMHELLGLSKFDAHNSLILEKESGILVQQYLKYSDCHHQRRTYNINNQTHTS